MASFFWIVGSVASFFSAQNAVMPLVGAFGGLAGATLFYGGRFLIRLFSAGSLAGLVSGKLLAFHVPGFCASLSWSVRASRLGSALMQVCLPVVCMALFTLHPVGCQAAAYSFYWIIPVALYAVSKFYGSSKSMFGKNIFLQSLSSTFIAHAVGSVIWLYTVGMTPAVWLSLIPVVFVERLLFAASMTAAYYALAGARSWISSRVRFLSFLRSNFSRTAC